MSREENMLGIFATNDDSDEEAEDADEELLASFSFNKNKRTKNIDFVSQNTKVQDKNIKKKEPIIVDTYVSTDEESNSNDEKQPEEEAEESVHVEIKKLEKPKQVLTGPTFAEKKKPVPKKHSSLNKSEQKEVGNWEKYEKGFGSKMLLKMGWEKGKGLGKGLHGRAIPVEATLRKGKGAVGKYGPESKDIGRERAAASDSDDEAPAHVSQWKNKSQNKKKLEYSTIRTTEELLTMASNNKKKLKRAEQMLDNNKSSDQTLPQPSMSKMKIIDMTGKQQGVYHGYDNISMLSGTGLKEQDKVNFDLPELVKNLDILVNMTEEKIILSEKK